MKIVSSASNDTTTSVITVGSFEGSATWTPGLNVHILFPRVQCYSPAIYPRTVS
jgi:hypothetical protein